MTATRLFAAWLARLRITRRRPLRRFRPRIESLEDRVTPASFSEMGNALTLTLAANEQLSLVASDVPPHNTIVITDSVSDTDPGFSGVTVSGTSITIDQNVITSLSIVDGGTAAGARVAFADSAGNAYLIPVTVALTDSASGSITFSGASTFTNVGLTAQTAGGSILSTSTSSLTLTGGPPPANANLSLTAGNDLLLLGSLNVAGTTAFQGDDITATNPANAFTGDLSFDVTGGGIDLTTGGALVLGGSTIATDFQPDSQIAAQGNITLDPADFLSGSSTGPALDFSSATGSINLVGNGGNNFTFAVGAAVSGNNTVALFNDTTTELANITTGSPPSGSIAPVLTVISGGTISQESGTAITAAGPTTFDIDGGTGDIVLNQPANNLSGAVTFSESAGGTVQNETLFNNSPAAAFPRQGSTPSVSELTLEFDSAGVVLPTLTIAGILSVTADGAIRQTGPITADGAQFTVEGDYPITLNNSSNAVTGDLSVAGPSSSQPVIVENSESIEMGAAETPTRFSHAATVSFIG